MNRHKMIQLIIGGVFVLLAIGAGYFALAAYLRKDAALEGDEENVGLESVRSSVRSLQRKPIFPSRANADMFKANCTSVTVWRTRAIERMSRSDRPGSDWTPPALKEYLIVNARRLSELPVAGDARMIPEGFGFGPFKEYIVEGKLPAEAKLDELNRQWVDFSCVVEHLSDCRICGLTDFQVLTAAAAEAQEGAGNRKKKKQKKVVADKPLTLSQQYQFSFEATPAAFIDCINTLTTCTNRYIVIDDFAFNRAKDTIALGLKSENEKKDAEKSGGRRSGRRRSAQKEEAEQPAESVPQHGILTDPVSDIPLSVTLKLTVHDFGSLVETAGDGEKQADGEVRK